MDGRGRGRAGPLNSFSSGRAGAQMLRGWHYGAAAGLHPTKPWVPAWLSFPVTRHSADSRHWTTSVSARPQTCSCSTSETSLNMHCSQYSMVTCMLHMTPLQTRKHSIGTSQAVQLSDQEFCWLRESN